MEKYKKLLNDMGSDSMRVIDAKSIVTAPWVIFKCKFGCGSYGKSWCCPPNTPNYKQTQEILDCYETAILFRCHDQSIVTDIALTVAKEMFHDGYYKVIALGSGTCKRCKECNMKGCNFPGKVAPTIEACGIDVFQTVKNNGYEIKTLRSEDEVQNHFGLILVE